jgi:hypothetical protein
MGGSILPLPQYVFGMWCLIKHEIRLHGVVLSYSINVHFNNNNNNNNNNNSRVWNVHDR